MRMLPKWQVYYVEANDHRIHTVSALPGSTRSLPPTLPHSQLQNMQHSPDMPHFSNGVLHHYG